jgi:hypothetical protein
MPLASLVNALKGYNENAPQAAYQANDDKLLRRFQDVLIRTYHLGVTSFGGPPVHFGIFYRLFVEGKGQKTPWIDEQTVRLFYLISTPNVTRTFVLTHGWIVSRALCAVPGPAGAWQH